jgi:hypothetical protein
MPSERFDTIFRRDLDRLEGLADHEWIPQARSARLRLTGGHLAAMITVSLAVVVVALSAQAARDTTFTQDVGPQPNPYFVAQSQGVSGSPTPGAPAWIIPPPLSPDKRIECPGGALPFLDVSFPPAPGFQPGTGEANAEEAFLRLRPDMRGKVWVTQPFGARPEAPVWIVANGETFIAQLIGDTKGNNWVAYPARFIGCSTEERRIP